MISANRGEVGLCCWLFYILYGSAVGCFRLLRWIGTEADIRNLSIEFLCTIRAWISHVDMNIEHKQIRDGIDIINPLFPKLAIARAEENNNIFRGNDCLYIPTAVRFH